MKRFLFTACFVLFAIITFGQSKSDNTLKFLGFPVDGSKEAMIKNLKTKGFTYHKQDDFDYMKGNFNGRSCNLFIHTNYGKVDRIMVSGYGTTSQKSNIIIEFNNLLLQFKDNSKYKELLINKPIPTEEDIRYGITVENKRYDASFYVLPQIDTNVLVENVNKKFLEKYPEDVLDKLSETEKQEAEKEWDMICMSEVEKSAVGCVWFMISYDMGQYEIYIYYDNRLNRPKGEDL